jgi:hypothetical protein
LMYFQHKRRFGSLDQFLSDIVKFLWGKCTDSPGKIAKISVDV